MKTYPRTLIQKVQALRTQGHTYREICTLTKTQIPKGTLSGWLKGISLPNAYYQKIRKLGGGNIAKAQAQNKKILAKRLTVLRNKNKSLLHHIDKPVGKLLLATLYWCEGAKYPVHTGIRFGSSDPEMIRLFITLLKRCYPVYESKFRLTVQCRADQNTRKLVSYWQKLTQIPPAKTYKTQIDKRSSGIPTQKKSYMGVCVIEYLDTDLQCELQFLGKSLGTSDSLSVMKNQIK